MRKYPIDASKIMAILSIGTGKTLTRIHEPITPNMSFANDITMKLLAAGNCSDFAFSASDKVLNI